VISDLLNAVKRRLSASIQAALLLALAGLALLVSVGFFVAALHSWLAVWYGTIQASLLLGAAFLVLAVIVFLIAALVRRAAARRLRQQQERLALQPAALVATLMGHLVGPKQTTLLMLAALLAGFLLSRPRGPKDGK
jgi:putative Ca2+/H+ antiporter (TMEM165/GDT1 family)